MARTHRTPPLLALLGLALLLCSPLGTLAGRRGNRGGGSSNPALPPSLQPPTTPPPPPPAAAPDTATTSTSAHPRAPTGRGPSPGSTALSSSTPAPPRRRNRHHTRSRSGPPPGLGWPHRWTLAAGVGGSLRSDWLEALEWAAAEHSLLSDPSSPYHRLAHGRGIQWAHDRVIQTCDCLFDIPIATLARERDHIDCVLHVTADHVSLALRPRHFFLLHTTETPDTVQPSARIVADVTTELAAELLAEERWTSLHGSPHALAHPQGRPPPSTAELLSTPTVLARGSAPLRSHHSAETASPSRASSDDSSWHTASGAESASTNEGSPSHHLHDDSGSSADPGSSDDSDSTALTKALATLSPFGFLTLPPPVLPHPHRAAPARRRQ